MRAAAYLAPLAGLAALAVATPGVAGCSTGCATCCLPATHTIQAPGVSVTPPSVTVGGVGGGYGGGAYGGQGYGGGQGGSGGVGGQGGVGGSGGMGGNGGAGGSGGSGTGGSGLGGTGLGGAGGSGSGAGGSGGAGTGTGVGGAASVQTSQGIGIAVQVVNNSAANASGAVFASASGTTTANSATVANLLASGGGSSFYVDQGPSSTIGVLNVEQPAAPVGLGAPVCLEYAPVLQVVAVQATCLDDKDVPHPASQVMPGRNVAPGYSGEVFRCIAGARMQYVLGSFAGEASFAHGQTTVCNKGDALWRDGGGRMQCRPQTPARDCNERSLLRRYGAGIKLVQVSGGGQCVRLGGGRSVAAAQGGPGPVTGLLIDGGVGGVAH